METFDLNQLTKKNQEYIHIATNKLISAGKSDAEVKKALSTILPSILEHQSKGVTARQLFGTPTNWVNSLTQVEGSEDKPATNDTPWLMWLDASLFILGIMALMAGILSFSKNQGQAYGLTYLLVMSATMGAIMYAMYHMVYRHLRKPRSERPKSLKTWLTLAMVMLVVLPVLGLTALLPASLNPVLPIWANFLLSALGFAGRFFLKKRYNVKSAITSRD